VQRRTDFVVIGSGIAGLRAALDLASSGDVVVLTKADPTESNTDHAQGGIAAAVGDEDSVALHVADTMAAGDGLCVEPAVRVLVEDGVRAAGELIDWGARFDRDAAGRLSLGREGAHSVRRVLHAKDATGREIGRALWTRVADQARIAVYNHTRAVDVIVEDGRAVGVRYLRADDTPAVAREVRSRAVLLATGGAGQVFRDTTNPAVATGDGIALAWRAGAVVADLEFVQFHPTALSVPGQPRVLLSEALRGEGAQLVNAAGDAFMTRYETQGDLAARDRVSRAIVHEQTRTGLPVFLSLQHLDPAWVHERFPTVAAACRSAGLDLARDPIPVGPAAHYVMGGVVTDVWGRTSLPGLLAAGEVACTGVHGANRLASNSLLEGLVFGARAAKAMLGLATAATIAGEWHMDASLEGRADRSGHSGRSTRPEPGTEVTERGVRALMWDAVGVVRDRPALSAAVEQLASWDRAMEQHRAAGALDDAHERLSSLVIVGSMMARAALRREESRGGHYRSDFPARDDVNWQVHIGEQRGP
jgi:L-aspartate oxidase